IKRTKPCGIQNSVLELNQSNFLGADHRLAPNIMCENSENTVIFSTAWEKMVEIPSPIILVMIIIERFIFRNTVDNYVKTVP
ncbi:hypothetical protein, partial [Glaesserella parasuis]|uniref:hypothetical protein n=1 Tax=Glaesserella parasuis TaxID=738 RepID=UPI001A9752A0